MKGTKWLSCLLTFALLAGLLVALPVLPEAAAASGVIVAETDFEDEGEIYPNPDTLSSPHYAFYMIKESGNETNTVLSSSEVRLVKQGWPGYLPIPAKSGDEKWFKMEQGTTYTISFRYKCNISYQYTLKIGLRFLALGSDGNPKNPGNPWPLNEAEVGYGKYKDLATIGANSTDHDWKTVEAEITLPNDSYGMYPCLNVYEDRWNWNGADTAVNVFYIDDIVIKRPAQVTLHENNGTEPHGFSLSSEAAGPGDLPRPVLPGATFEGWYTDKMLTQPASGKPQEGDKFYAKWNSFAIDFDNHGTAALRSSESEVQEGAGTDGSKAIHLAETWQQLNQWPAGLYLRGNDGNDMRFLAGHQYSVTFDCKYATSKRNTFGIYSKYSQLGDSYALVSSTITMTTDYTTHTLTFTPNSDTYGYLIVTPTNVSAADCWIDNVRVVDTGAQFTAVVNGESCKGYAGDPIPVSQDDTLPGHATGVGIQEEVKHFWNWKDYGTGEEEPFVKTTAQFVVTGVSFDGKTLYLRYNDLLYRAADGSLQVLSVYNEQQSREYGFAVKKVGVLIGAPGSELTVGSAAEGELQILDYNNEGSLFASVAIEEGQTARPYVETTDGTVLYGEARTPLSGAFGEISAQAAYTPLDDVFAAWDFDGNGTVTDADGVAALRGLLLNGGAEGKGDLTGGGRDICDLVYLNAVLNNAPSYKVAE